MDKQQIQLQMSHKHCPHLVQGTEKEQEQQGTIGYKTGEY